MIFILLSLNLLCCYVLDVCKERPLVATGECIRLKGYLWSKLYHILKGQALSCLVLLRCDPSNAPEFCSAEG